MTETMKAREERPDPAGIVRRGDAVKTARSCLESLDCFVDWGDSGIGCEEKAAMEVYGLPMCEAHGEEAAYGALSEIADDLEQELLRLVNKDSRSLSPHLERAWNHGLESLPAEAKDYQRGDALLLEAFPLDRERTNAETLAYVEEPDADWCAGQAPPFDNYLDVRRLICRHMREAFEEGAFWLVEMLEAKREEVSAQAAYALALEKEAGLR